ncbi:hypothetical protein KJ059_03190 [Myxococcota bacterium]|nr:hypothetical protein [Myxococcota bacterium]
MRDPEAPSDELASDGGPIDLAPWLAQVESLIAAHRCGPGRYARWRTPGFGRQLEPNPYGAADAANLFYTLGGMPPEPAERTAIIDALRDFQDPETGWFHEPTHHEIHTTAHCLAALELFDAGPRHRLTALAGLEAPGALEAFLDGLAWRDDPWHASHRGAGVYAARVLAGEASEAFRQRYFAWLAREIDPDTGLWRRGCVAPPYPWGVSRFPHLAGTFHYLFNLEHARQPHPAPAALVDTCLELLATDPYPLGRGIGFAEIDWVYCLSRALAQSSHRAPEARAALRAFAVRYTRFLLELDLDRDDGAADLHRLFGAVCALAELQRVLPGQLVSRRPLRLVLDRRPFI